MNYAPPVRLEYTKEQACVAYWLALAESGVLPTIELVTVLVAHGALETGHFAVGCWSNNVGNIKAGNSWPGEYTCIVLNEVEKRGNGYRTVWYSPEGELSGGRGSELLHPPLPVPPGHPQTRMRAYPSLALGVADKISFIRRSSYAVAFNCASRGDVSGYVRAIRFRGYFTAHKGEPDPTPYERSVISLASTYRPIVERVMRGELSAAVKAWDELPMSAEECSPLEACRADIIGGELRAQVQTANEPIMDAILAEARRRD